MKKYVCIFCGANKGNSKEIIEQTKLLCNLLICVNYNLVYGGASIGLMGIVADQFLNAGMEVIGVRPKKLIESEDAHNQLTELIVVDTMQERKSEMIALSDLFIALPGGVGTLDEIIETFTLFKIGFFNKPSGILNTSGYYDGLMLLLEKMTDKGFITEKAKSGLIVADTPEELLSRLDI